MSYIGQIFIMFCCCFCFTSTYGQAAENDDIKHISIVSDEWINYTNKDGSGAYWEVVRAVFEPLNITVQPRVMPWIRAELTVKNQQADALVGSYHQGNKQAELIFPKWHISMEDPIIAVYKNNKGIEFQTENLLSFQPLKLIWVRGYEFDKTLFKGMTIKKHLISKPRQALIMLKLNRADVFIDYEYDIKEAALDADIDLDNQYKMEIIKSGNKLYVAFSNTPRGIKLSKLFDQQMESLANNGTIQAIYKRWGFASNKFTH